MNKDYSDPETDNQTAPAGSVPEHQKPSLRRETGLTLKRIAHIESDFPTKFGIPRQSGLNNRLQSRIVMEPEYRNPHAFRGIEDYSHLWLIWEFSEAVRDDWSPTVLPPRLGGKTRMGVFATRSPFRPNALALSCVQLDRYEVDPKLGPVLYVLGADLMDGTPIYDIKPYLAFTDSHPDATEGFAGPVKGKELNVHFPSELLSFIPEAKRDGLIELLSEDPRPSYQNDPDRIYGVEFDRFDVRFRVEEDTLTVVQVVQVR